MGHVRIERNKGYKAIGRNLGTHCGCDLENSTTGTRTQVARVRAEYPNQLDYEGSAMISIEKRRRFAGGSECARLALRKTRQADVCSDGYGVSGFSEHGPRQAEKRAAPGIEPGKSRTRSENYATRPSSQ